MGGLEIEKCGGAMQRGLDADAEELADAADVAAGRVDRISADACANAN